MLIGEVVSFIVFFIGMYGLITQRNIVKSIISLEIVKTAAILYFIVSGYKEGLLPPIGEVSPSQMVDPLPQALMITAIVIGVSSTAIALTMYIHLYRKYGTKNWEEAMKKRVM